MKQSRLSFSADIAAFILSITGFILSLLVSTQVFEAIPHIEDEMAYTWQAKLYAGGQTTIASPPCPTCFMVPFIIDYEGVRFSKYPPGWPALLSIGEKLGVRQMVNPFLTAFSIWLVYRLVKKVDHEKTALLTAFLVTTSPFVLMNSGSLLSHSWSLFLTLALSLAWLETFSSESRIPRWLTISIAGISLGLIALTRPLTAVGIVIPFFLHGVYILVKGSRQQKVFLILTAAISGILALFYFVWQFDLTGNALQNPYTLYWSYDRIGFGPGHGIQQNGYALRHAWINARFSLTIGMHDLLGWPYLSWLFIPFGLIAVRKNRKAWLLSAFFPALVLIYTLYWIGSWLYGPRYYYEGIISVAFLTAAGIRWLAGSLDFRLDSPRWSWKTLRFTLTTLVALFLIACNLYLYTPQRLNFMHGLYGIERAQMEPFLTRSAEDMTPALVIVHTHQRWHEYGALIDLTSPYLDSPFLITLTRGSQADQELAAHFPGRAVFHYDTLTPGTFYPIWQY
jgi:hypothetical protein